MFYTRIVKNRRSTCVWRIKLNSRVFLCCSFSLFCFMFFYALISSFAVFFYSPVCSTVLLSSTALFSVYLPSFLDFQFPEDAVSTVIGQSILNLFSLRFCYGLSGEKRNGFFHFDRSYCIQLHATFKQKKTLMKKNPEMTRKQNDKNLICYSL